MQSEDRPPIGVLQGRLTPSKGRGIQFFPDGPDEWEREFEVANSIGLETIEILVRKNSTIENHPLLSTRGQERIKELSQESHIAIPSVHAFYTPADSYTDQLHAIVQGTHAIGATIVLLSFFKDAKLSPAPDETWEGAVRLIDPILKRAQECGIRFGVEAELPADTLLQFFSHFSMPEVLGSYYDLGNQFACGFPVEEELRQFGPRILGIHVKDRLPNADPTVESATVPLGTGCANLEGAFKTLHEIGYRRSLIIQGARQEGVDDVAVVKQYRDYVATLAEKTWASYN